MGLFFRGVVRGRGQVRLSPPSLRESRNLLKGRRLGVLRNVRLECRRRS
jgi:hypothetical protein